MTQRLSVLSNHISSKKNKIGDLTKIANSSFDFLSLSEYLSPAQNQQRKAIQAFVQREIKQKIVPYIEKSEFASYLLPLLKKQGFIKHLFPKPYGYGSRITMQGILLAEIAKGDAGIATFLVVTRLLGFTINKFGSTEQKQKYLQKLANLDITGAWALTEVNIGSDASHIETKSEKYADGYVINGNKNWIGNGTGDLVCIWSRDNKTNKMEGFLLQAKNLQGFESKIIKNKHTMRSINHCEINLRDVRVHEEQKLPFAKDFQNGTSQALQSSRISVLWVATGICMGSYEEALKYSTLRQQFGRSVSCRVSQIQLFR